MRRFGEISRRIVTNTPPASFDVRRRMATRGDGNSTQSSGSMDPSNSLHRKDTELSKEVDQDKKGEGMIRFMKINHPCHTEFQELKKEYYKLFAIAQGMPIDRYLKSLDEHSRSFIPKNSKVCMRINVRVLKDIIAKGDHFKSMYMANKFLSDTTKRLTDEKVRLGNYSTKVPSEFRPIYGYIATREQPLGIREEEKACLDLYGRVAVVFKDCVKQRTSFLVGDSSEANALAVPLENPNGDCFPLDEPLTATPSKESIRERDPLSKGFGHWLPFVEAQIHYGASLKDVDYVVLAGLSAYDNEMIDMLKKANISTRLQKI